MLPTPLHHNGQDTAPLSADKEALSPVRTVSERDRFIVELQSLKDNLENGNQISKKIDAHLSMQNKEAFLTILRSRKIDENNAAPAARLIAELIVLLNKIPVVSLSIPIDLPNAEVESISRWFLENVDKKVFLDIAIEKSLIAGATVASNGLYRDFSLRELNPK